MKYLVIASLLVSSTAVAETEFVHDVPKFVEQASLAGINHQYKGPFEYFVGGGAASFDCNGDRMSDLFIAGGEDKAQLFVNTSDTGSNITFEVRDLFEDGKGLSKVTGAYPIHLNDDEYIDLIVLRVGKNYLLKGGEGCSFTKANKEFGFDGGKAWTTAFAATWEDESKFPTLAFGNYIDQNAAGSPWGTCEDNQVVRANHDGQFSSQLNLNPSYCTLSIMFTDWNNTGKFDLRVTNDRQYYRGGQEQMWALEDEPRAYSGRDGWRKLVIWGMGIAEADLNGDGRPEYALSSMGDTMLQSIDEEAEEDTPVYRDIAFDRRSTAHRPYTGGDLKPSTGWHTEFADFNNDSRTDLFIAKGNVSRMPDFAAFDPDNLLLGKQDGTFSEQGESAGISLPTRGRGAVIEDFNADGMLDLLVVNRESNVSLFRNTGRDGKKPMGNFLSIELQNGKFNRSAIGAKISVKTGNLTQTHTVKVGGGHASGRTGFVHFGLGVAERAHVRIKWPDGDWSHTYRVFSNNFVVIGKDESEAKYWYPK